jgi:hypothetical protein
MSSSGKWTAPDKREKPHPTDEFRAKWWYIGRRHRLMYLLYILPLLVITFATAIIVWLPWWLFKSCRPAPPSWVLKQPRSSKYRSHSMRDVFSPLGLGPEGDKGTSIWRGWWLRVWMAYEMVREMWHTARRQGLQVLGVLGAFSVLVMQLEMMVHDWTNSAVSATSNLVIRGVDTVFSTPSILTQKSRGKTRISSLPTQRAPTSWEQESPTGAEGGRT